MGASRDQMIEEMEADNECPECGKELDAGGECTPECQFDQAMGRSDR